jgi:P4 family phage/plasmid primase-like protien
VSGNGTSTPPPTARAAAGTYHGRGWVSVPIPPGGKRPMIDAWQRRTLADVDAADYDGTGIGIILGAPSGDLVDVDLDCTEAIRVAPDLLPPTRMVHGRASRPASHAWYVCVGAAPAQYRNPTGNGREMLVELRAGKGDDGAQQTVVPPSVHPSGEEIRWWTPWPPAPATIGCEDLRHAVADVAAAALLARYHPGDGARHEFALRLAGVLAHGGYPQDRAERLVVAVSRAAGDEDQEDRAKCVTDTYEKLAAGEPVAGGPSLAELLGEHGEKIVKTLKKWLGLCAERQSCEPPPLGDDEAPSASSRSFRLTELGNAERFAARHGDWLRYVGDWGAWQAWDGKRWRRNETGREIQAAKAIVRELYAGASEAAARAAATVTDDITGDTDNSAGKIAGALARWARKSSTASAIRAMVSLARSESPIAATSRVFNCDPFAFNCLNGTLDLRTGHLRPHRQLDMITMLAPVGYDPQATCPRWNAFLARVLPDAAVRTWVQRFAGYSLTGNIGEHVLAFAYGGGANGKTTLIEVLLAVFGDYARSAAPDLLLAKHGETHPTEVADLEGARLVVCQEVEEGRAWAESTIKRLTGGDRITARRMRQDFYSFAPSHKLVVAANTKPTVRGTDEAIWRRMRLVPFDVTIPEAERDKSLVSKLIEERAGILRWAVDGCLAWQREGLGEPEAVAAATADYRADQDVLGTWIDEECTLFSEAWCATAALYANYSSWCERAGRKPWTRDTVRARLLERPGITAVNRNNGRGLAGIGLRSDRPHLAVSR